MTDERSKDTGCLMIALLDILIAIDVLVVVGGGLALLAWKWWGYWR